VVANAWLWYERTCIQISPLTVVYQQPLLYTALGKGCTPTPTQLLTLCGAVNSVSAFGPITMAMVDVNSSSLPADSQRENYQNCSLLCTPVVHNDMHTRAVLKDEKC